ESPITSHQSRSSIKLSGCVRLAAQIEEVLDLTLADARYRKLGQRSAGEEIDLARLLVRARLPTDQLTQKKQFVDVEGKRRLVALFLTIIDRQQPDRPRLKTRFLPDFTHHGLRGRFVDIGPAAGNGPAPGIQDLAHHEDAIVTKDDSAHIHLRRGITKLG